MTEAYRPSPALPIPGTLRGLSGDKRLLLPLQATQIIDLELDMPRPLLVIVTMTDLDNPFNTPLSTVELNVGVNRSPTDSEIAQVQSLSRAVLARSVTVVVRNNDNGEGVPRLEVTAVVVPLDVQVPASMFGASRRVLNPGAANVPSDSSGGTDPLVDSILGKPAVLNAAIAQTTVSTLLVAASWRGTAIFNNATSALLMRLGPFNPGNPVTATSLTLSIAPQGYYETPFGYSGAICGVWTAAGAGRANLTTVVS